MFTQELTLIVAATRNMGIGRAGTLPWTGLKKEMAYFARVTKRVEAQSSGTAEPSVCSSMWGDIWTTLIKLPSQSRK